MGTLGTRRVTFVSHEATLTGAPLVLLHFLRWLRANTTIGIDVVLVRGGELEEQFRAVGSVTRLDDTPKLLGYGHRALRAGGVPADVVGADRRRRLRHLSTPAAVYINSVPGFSALEYLPNGRRPVLAHVHELSAGMRGGLRIPHDSGVHDADRILRRAHRFVAASDAIRTMLEREHGVPTDRVDRVYEFIDVERTRSATAISSARLREALRIPAHAPVVVGCGVVQWRKGPDLFVQLAAALRRAGTAAPVHLVWVGGYEDKPLAEQIYHDLRVTGLTDTVHFVGLQPSALDYFRMADVFVLPSREDPLPLVCLEASLLETPVVSFDSGGMTEFLADGCGFLVPYLDVEAMARQVIDLLHRPDAGLEAAQRAAAKVRAHHDAGTTAPQLYECLDRVIAEGSRPAITWAGFLADPSAPARSAARSFDERVSSALAYLGRSQLEPGDFPAATAPLKPGPRQWEEDRCIFPTALILRALSHVDRPDAMAISSRAAQFLIRQMEPSCLWRYWSSHNPRHGEIPPDADDTACAALALRRRGVDTSANRHVLLANRDRRGRFYTWLIPRGGRAVSLDRAAVLTRRHFFRTTPSDRADIDAVVNANVVHYLGNEAPPEPVDWLLGLLRSSFEWGSDSWYADPLPLYHSLSCAIRDGQEALAAEANLIVDRVLERLLLSGSSLPALGTAQAVLTLANLAYDGSELREAVGRLAGAQGEDGGWPPDIFCVSDRLARFGWGSSSLTTALCLEALIRTREIAP
jgi:glycosyltransferase involved in cell wall biosynthesis